MTRPRTTALAALGRFFVLLAPFCVYPAPGAWACSCVESTAGAEAALQGHDAVFLGQIVEMRLQPTGRPPQADGRVPVEGLEVVAKVLESWKGTTGDRIVLRTNSDGASCGYLFQIGADYLIWAQQSEDGLWVGLCGRTKPLNSPQGTTDRDALRKSAEVARWQVVAASGFSLRLPDGFVVDSAGDGDERLTALRRTWGVPLKPPQVGGWRREGRRITYEVVGYPLGTEPPRCESSVAGHPATLLHQSLEDGSSLVSVHWPNVLPAPGGSKAFAFGGLTVHCASGPGSARDRENLCERVFETVQFPGASANESRARAESR